MMVDDVVEEGFVPSKKPFWKSYIFLIIIVVLLLIMIFLVNIYG